MIIFSLPNGREKKYLFIFTTIFWGRENEQLFIFTFLIDKKNFLFSLPFSKRRKENMFQAITGCLVHFPIGKGILYPLLRQQCIHHQ